MKYDDEVKKALRSLKSDITDTKKDLADEDDKEVFIKAKTLQEQIDQGQEDIIIWAESGQIEHYEVPVVSEDLKTLLVGLILGCFCGFVWATIVWKVIL